MLDCGAILEAQILTCNDGRTLNSNLREYRVSRGGYALRANELSKGGKMRLSRLIKCLYRFLKQVKSRFYVVLMIKTLAAKLVRQVSSSSVESCDVVGVTAKNA